MNKALVAYFSAEGTTAQVAARLAQAIGADLFAIEPDIPYTRADLNWMNPKSRSTLEMKDRACRPAIRALPETGEYDTIFVGFPIWWYREPSIIDTFAESCDFAGKTLIPFATSGGSGMGKSSEHLRALAKGASVAEGKRFSARVKEEELRAWADQF